MRTVKVIITHGDDNDYNIHYATGKGTVAWGACNRNRAIDILTRAHIHRDIQVVAPDDLRIATGWG
jgi:hypothetical protein